MDNIFNITTTYMMDNMTSDVIETPEHISTTANIDPAPDGNTPSLDKDSDYYWNNNYTDTSALFAIVDVLDLYYLPIMIIIGIIGNSISFMVFTFSVLNTLSLSVYLAALAVSDNLFLLSLTVSWLDTTGLRLFHSNGWCQLTVYISYVCSFLSVWLIVSYTIERYIAICHPMQRSRMCTTRRAWCVVICLCVTSLAMYAFTLRMTGIAVYENHGKFCTPYLSEYYYNIHLALTYVDSIISFLLPFFVILTFNMHLFRTMRFFYSQKCDHVPIASLQHCPPHFHRHPNMQEVCQQNQGQVKVTKLILIVSTAFLVISLPSYVIRIRIFVTELVLGGFHSTLQEALVQQLCQYMFYLNYGINILLYVICWGRFRRIVLKRLLRIKVRLAKALPSLHCVRLPRSRSSFSTSIIQSQSMTDTTV